jgi:hypothetical protein
MPGLWEVYHCESPFPQQSFRTRIKQIKATINNALNELYQKTNVGLDYLLERKRKIMVALGCDLSERQYFSRKKAVYLPLKIK